MCTRSQLAFRTKQVDMCTYATAPTILSFSTQNGRLVAHAHLLHPICSVHPRASCSLHCSASTTTQTMSSQQTTYLHLFRTPFIGFFFSLTGPTPGKWNLQRWMMRWLIQLLVRRDRVPQATLGPRAPQSTRELCTDSLHLIFRHLVVRRKKRHLYLVVQNTQTHFFHRNVMPPPHRTPSHGMQCSHASTSPHTLSR